MACASLVGDYCCLTESRWKGDSCYLMQMIARSVMRLAVSVGSGVVVEKSWESHWKEMNDRTTRSVLIANHPLSTSRDRTPNHHRGQTIARLRSGHGKQIRWVLRRAPSSSSCLETGDASSATMTNEALSVIGHHGDCVMMDATAADDDDGVVVVDAAVDYSKRRTCLLLQESRNRWKG